MSEPLVSVVLPIYNRVALLKCAANSVLSQDYHNLELIIVDDASQDDIAAAVESLNDPRVRYLRRNRNGGPAAARNSGIEAAVGEFIAFQDSDDQWLPGKLRRQVETLLAAPVEVALVYVDVARTINGACTVYPGAQLVRKSGDLGDIALGDGLLFAYAHSWLVRKSALQAVGLYDPDLRISEDWELCIRLARRFRIAHVPGVYVTSQRLKDSLTNDRDLWLQMLRRIVEKHATPPIRGSRGAARLYYRLARYEFLHGDRSRGWRALRTSLMTRPAGKALALTLLALSGLERRLLPGARSVTGGV